MKGVIFEKLISLHLIKNLLALYGTWRLLTWFLRTEFQAQHKVRSMLSKLYINSWRLI